jgi:hypothetical protein
MTGVEEELLSDSQPTARPVDPIGNEPAVDSSDGLLKRVDDSA